MFLMVKFGTGNNLHKHGCNIVTLNEVVNLKIQYAAKGSLARA